MRRMPNPVHVGPGVDLERFLEQFVRFVPEDLAVVEEARRGQQPGSYDLARTEIPGGVSLAALRDGTEIELSLEVTVSTETDLTLALGPEGRRFSPVMEQTPRGLAASARSVCAHLRHHPDLQPLRAVPTDGGTPLRLRRARPEGTALAAPFRQALEATFAEAAIAHGGIVEGVREDPRCRGEETVLTVRDTDGGWLPWMLIVRRQPSVVVRIVAGAGSDHPVEERVVGCNPARAARVVAETAMIVPGLLGPGKPMARGPG
jgi:hypothetical protein